MFRIYSNSLDRRDILKLNNELRRKGMPFKFSKEDGKMEVDMIKEDLKGDYEWEDFVLDLLDFLYECRCNVSKIENSDELIEKVGLKNWELIRVLKYYEDNF